MKKTLSAIVIGALLISVSFISCKKTSDAPDTSGNHVLNYYTGSLSGLGTHGGLPAGFAFAWPSNIKIIGYMTGGDPGSKTIFKLPKNLKNIPSSLSKGNYTEYGIGTYVNVYMKLYNTNNTPYQLIIPSGVIMCDSFPNDTTVVDTSQSGIIIPPDTINIPGSDTVGVCLKSFCLNEHHAAPSSLNKYKFAVITSNESLHTVVTILRNKKSLSAHISDIQTILWKITDGQGLSQADIDMMNSWN